MKSSDQSDNHHLTNVFAKFDSCFNNDFRQAFKEKLHVLVEKAPSDASISSRISKVKKIYDGTIEVISSQGKFIAKAFGHDPNRLVLELIDQIQIQILNWRNQRVLSLQ